MNFRLPATLIFLAISTSAPLLFAATSQPTMVIASGSIRGMSSAGVDSFLGIPYAQPPIGALRWRAPEKVAPWQGTRETTAFSAACYQSPPTPFGPYTKEFLIDGPVSEDCLYLNVWTPSHHTTSLPVLVFIHGGGFGSGSASIPIYNGSQLASRGLIVVTLNYRLAVFGYLAHPELSRESALRSSGNYGILDVIEALNWVKRNASKFGGDPDKVTVSGQSAGAAAVNDLIVSPQAKGLFAHAIAQSGSGMGLPMKRLSEAEEDGKALAVRLHADSLSALRAMSAAELLQATRVEPPKPGEKRGTAIAAAPNIDGTVIASDPDDPQAAVQSRIDLLTGFNTDEGLLFGAQPVEPQEFEAKVRERYGDFADRFLALYPHASPTEAMRSTGLLARDRYLASLVIWADARSKRSGAPVFTYLFDHPYPPIPNQPSAGAFHTAEVPYVFGVLNQSGRTFTDADRRVSREIEDYWITFCRTGRPAAAWPAVAEANAGSVMGIGDTHQLRPAVSTPERLSLFRHYVGAGHTLSLF